MPRMTQCRGCRKRVGLDKTSSPEGPLCRDCRTRVCANLACGAAFHGRHWSPFCTPACGRQYWHEYYQKRSA